MKQKTFLRCLYLGIFLLTLLIGGIIMQEGLPFFVHRDEELLFKRPLKRIYQYLNGDFTATTNLFDLLLLAWYGLGFLLGKIIGLWPELEHFKEELILQNPHLIQWGRCLSTLYVALGNVCLARFFTHFTSKRGLLTLASVSVVCNPILLPSVFLMKLEGLVYLSSCLLFILTYSYLILDKKNLAFGVYFIGFFALAVRVELLVFPSICILHDLWYQRLFKRKGLQTPFLKGATFGLLSSSILTLYPFHLWHQYFSNSPSIQLEEKITYGGKILSRILHNFRQPTFLSETWDTLWYYVDLLGIVLGPILLVAFFLSVRKTNQHVFYVLHLTILLGIICLFGHTFVHYSLGLSLLIQMLACLWIIQSSWKYAYFILLVHLLWVGSLSLAYLYPIYQHPPPLLQAHHYLLNTTQPTDLLAVETLSGAAAHPHLWECRIEERMQAAQELSPFGGTGYQLALERGHNQPCRNQVDICEVNYLSPDADRSTPFVNTYDIAHLDRIQPAWYISTSYLLPLSKGELEGVPPPSSTPSRQDSFYQHILQRYELDRVFHKNEHFFDSRTRKINIRVTFYVYRRKNY